jgi:protein-tyrosine phosphatase
LIDLHCHILPNIDDGPSTIEESLVMARIAVQDGIHTIVTTPHNQNGMYMNVVKDIGLHVKELNRILKEKEIQLEVLPGAEEHVRPGLGSLEVTEDYSTINDNGRYVLVEFPFMTIPHGTRDVLFRMRQKKLTPVLAHPERNSVLQNNFDLLGSMIKIGCLTQITAMSLTGELGRSAMECAYQMVEMRLAHVIASDAHSVSYRRPELSPAVEIAAQILGNRQEAEDMVMRTPQAIISGQDVKLRVFKKTPPPKKWWRFGS